MNNKNLLIIEDHSAMIEGYKSILSLDNPAFNFYTATSISEAENLLSRSTTYDLVLLDISLLSNGGGNRKTGRDIGILVRKRHPEAKVIIVTSHVEKFLIHSLTKELYPDGFLIKSDFTPYEFLIAIKEVLGSKKVFSETVANTVKEIEGANNYLDATNRKIIYLINEGLKTKNLSVALNLSISAIDKRKASIKNLFRIKKGSDEDIIREAKKRGFV